MKKIFGYLLTIIAFIFTFTTKVNAVNYDGALGYDYSSTSTNFYFLIEDSDIVSVDLYIDSLQTNYHLIKDDSGIYFTNVNGDLKNQEYYYKVCYVNSECIDTLDPFAKTINTDKTKNVILDDNSILIDNWDQVTTIDTTTYNKSIYAIDADKFVSNISESGSVFEKLISSSKYSSVNIGYNYVTSLGMKYLEVGNLYDDNNYFSPNQEYSSKANNYSAITELKNVILGYKNSKMNIILRTNFLTPSEDLKNTLSLLSSTYIVDNKINLNDPMMQNYIKYVYEYWVNEYKVDGFYIEDAILYNSEYLTSLISDLKGLNSSLLIYTNDKNSTEYYTSDEIQNSLFGSLLNASNEGILNGNYTEENFTKLVNNMFGGYYSTLSNYKQASKVINNIGSLDGADIYSKLMVISGLGTRESIILSKVQLALYTIFSSSGIPRLVAGNEFLNTTTIPTDDIANTSEDKMICNNSKTLCYGINELKTINWEYLYKNSSSVSKMMNYRTNYTYQYPSYYSMYNAKSINYDQNLITSGVLYLTINYNANYTGDIQKSVLLINYSGSSVSMNQVSSRDYQSISPLLGKISDSDDKTLLGEYTLFTFTETKNQKLSNWVYIIITIGLFIFIFSLRAILIKLLKTKRGIDYNEYVKEQRALKKKNKKEKVREPSVFETYLSDETIFKAYKEEKAKKKEMKKQEKAKKVNNDDNVKQDDNNENKSE